MKRITLSIVILFLAFSFTACGHVYMGRVIRKDMTRKIQSTSEQNHRYILDHLVLDYSYAILPDQQMILFDGFVNDRQQDPDAHFVQDTWTLEEAYLDIYFLNENRKAVGVCRKKFPLGHFAFPYPFKAKCRYTPEYKYIAPTYLYKYIRYTAKGKAEKIYYHELKTE